MKAGKIVCQCQDDKFNGVPCNQRAKIPAEKVKKVQKIKKIERKHFKLKPLTKNQRKEKEMNTLTVGLKSKNNKAKDIEVNKNMLHLNLIDSNWLLCFNYYYYY